MDAIYANDLTQLQALTAQNFDLNFKYEHQSTELDDLVTPLAAAAYLGRLEMVSAILDCKFIDVNLPTESTRNVPSLYKPPKVHSFNGRLHIRKL